MPHSPYHKTVYPQVHDVDSFRRELILHRESYENGERDKERDEQLLDIGEVLVEHCDFLEQKLLDKVHIYLLQGTLPRLLD